MIDCAWHRLAVQIARTQLRDYASQFARSAIRNRRCWPVCAGRHFCTWTIGSGEALLASAQALRAALGLHAVPDHATLWWFTRHKVKPRLLARVLSETVRLFQQAAAPHSRTVAVDSTGFARAPASPYDQQRVGHRHRAKTWLQWSVAVWTAPLIRCGPIADRGPRGDHVECRPLVTQTLARRR